MDAQLSTQVVKLAEAQHGLVTHAQLLALGMRPLHRGVYALGHTALREEGRWLAAVFACGEGAVVSHTSAARLWSMSSVPADPAVHVTVQGGDRRRPGIVVHRNALTRADVTVVRGVPTTAKARTLVDLAAIVPYATLRRIADHGVRLDAGALRRAAARSNGRRGRGNLARLLGDGARTRSGPERLMRQLSHRAGLARPHVNHRVLGHERDFAWPEHRLVVEVDGHAVHAPRGAREVDHERDAELVLAGWRVLRFTADQVEHEPAVVVGLLRRALAL
jgi:very-short-patch-repair endonuclease